MNICQIILIVLNLGIGFYMVFSVMRTLVELIDFMKDYLLYMSSENSVNCSLKTRSL